MNIGKFIFTTIISIPILIGFGVISFFPCVKKQTLPTYTEELKDLSIHYKLPAHIAVKSSLPDTSALGGFAECGNEAKPLFCAFFKFFNKQGFFIYIDTSKIVPFGEHSYEKYKGYKIFIVNKTDSVVKLPAINSTLYAVAEVYYKGKWHEIEYILYSWCGNSYHSVFLRPGEYWEDVVPKYTGKIKSKMRYKLFVSKGQYVYSNEVPISFNKGQLYIREDSLKSTDSLDEDLE